VDFWEYNEHTIDGKGRLVLPSSFRAAFADGGVLTNQGDYVGLHTPSTWEQAFRAMRDSENFTVRELAVVKSFVTRFEPDAQNRVTLPSRLRTAVGLERDVALIGMGNHVALYPRDRWQVLEGEVLGGAGGVGPSLAERLAVAL
jgi:MraZ protein